MTLSVTGAARLLGVHPNTVRTWTEQGRLRCLRINARGDRRYPTSELHAFVAAAGLRGVPRSNERAVAGANGLAARVLAASGVRAEAPPSEWASAAARSVGVLAETARNLVGADDVETACGDAARLVRAAFGYRTVAIAERVCGVLNVHAVEPSRPRASAMPLADEVVLDKALRDRQPVVTSVARRTHEKRRPATPDRPASVRICVPIAVRDRAWGALFVEDDRARVPRRNELDVLQAVADLLAGAVDRVALGQVLRQRQQQAEMLAHITTDLGSRLDGEVIEPRLVEHALALFRADRAAVFRRTRSGAFRATASSGLSAGYLGSIGGPSALPLAAMALTARRPMVGTDLGNDPRADPIRDAVMREGYDTIAVAPLMSGDEVIGFLGVYHDVRHDWQPDELQVLAILGAQAGVALRNAENYARMATRAAQLHGIQQLGARINGLTSVVDIGQAIASQLDQLIGYHNVRVYRVDGDDVIPVAWRGAIGEYVDETGDQLRMRVGEGITGWVARHGVVQYLPDAARDPRAQTIPGTEDDLDESLLVAPMLYEGRVIGVIVLAKLGLDQFTDDDLRLLEIFASIAAQAVVNADASERLRAQSTTLERQLASQRELLRVTESILGTLDPRDVLEEIADRLGALIDVDNLGIDLYDPGARLLRPIFARGVHAELFMGRTLPDDKGVGGWVVRTGEAELVQDELDDARVAHFDQLGVLSGALIVAPLRGRDRVTGLLTLERLGASARFSAEEFELIKLFAGHVSIALQNAQAHHAAEVRAQTDALTGLKNQGAFHEFLARAVARGVKFSLLVLDLDQFKRFNDRRGHQAGDMLLQGIAGALQGAGRETDEVFRYGGDEFALILPDTGAAGAYGVAERARRAIHRVPAPGSRRNVESGVTCSVGVATFPVDGTVHEDVLLAADRACYVAKRAGGDRTATAAEGLALAGEFLPTAPTPVDEPLLPASAA